MPHPRYFSNPNKLTKFQRGMTVRFPYSKAVKNESSRLAVKQQITQSQNLIAGGILNFRGDKKRGGDSGSRDAFPARELLLCGGLIDETADTRARLSHIWGGGK